jgi:large subunit ribosomal protein L3
LKINVKFLSLPSLKGEIICLERSPTASMGTNKIKKMSGIIGKKVGMTSIFDEGREKHSLYCNRSWPLRSNTSQVCRNRRICCCSVSIWREKGKKHLWPLKGHFQKAGTTPKRKLVEFKTFEDEKALGDTVTVDIFAAGDFVDVVGTSKGKGFQGVVKRHGFGGVGMQTHGQHNRLRAPGSLGASSWPSRVFKGMRMAGQMGNVRVKVQNLEVVKVFAEQNLIVVKGSIPGAKGSFVIVDK